MATLTPDSQIPSSLAGAGQPFSHANDISNILRLPANLGNPNVSRVSASSSTRARSVDKEDDLREMMTSSDPLAQEISACQAKLTDEQMAHFATMDLTGLCAAAKQYAIRKRMTEDMCKELADMFYDFRCKVVKQAIQNQVGDHLYFERLGQNQRVRGVGTSWNNFQKYDPKAQKLYKEFGRNMGGAKVKALWDSKKSEEKIQYRNVDFLNTLRDIEPNPPPSPVTHPEAVAEDIINAK
ncbi:hypothetical protein PCANC_28014 [Puccinia coronata f. sp. avenae]|uniref:Uncharacterized protein n=1 Tax=Puccinia coronata f. sp. avenae TaxID=200324 RepID=A0A2N5S3N4_9BASI|nr:hypothetical protein PCASD_26639 [Puccinia coronata f. sp. avenae]PLW24843.1 hypothetical protein PCANC_28014 [Puccinia coronata f. sp. avenae]PLW33348.1 hypothetical protein PCASD_18003 [Puccinia coronata f. sp. avenae]